jgi:hypothetical protein
MPLNHMIEDARVAKIHVGLAEPTTTAPSAADLGQLDGYSFTPQ